MCGLGCVMIVILVFGLFGIGFLVNLVVMILWLIYFKIYYFLLNVSLFFYIGIFFYFFDWVI